VRLTIAFITGRAEPRLDWMLKSLAPQVRSDDVIDVLVIDARGRTPQQLGAASRHDSNVRVALPKPTPWQGAHRITSCDWWAKSSAMNTALVLCDTDYIAFLDDCCRLGPKWLQTVRRGERRRRSVLAGTYSKIEHGKTVLDHRAVRFPEGKKNCDDGWLYGCTFALPLEWALEVNGVEEGCDGLGAEDYIFGFMLKNNGHRIDFKPDMEVTQQRGEIFRPGDPGSSLRRADKGVSPNDKSHAALARFRTRTRTEFTPDLRALRAQRAAGKLVWPMPDPQMRDWYDGQLVREIK
jgi:glycosyltransferase involved in cell wall biosynthesis